MEKELSILIDIGNSQISAGIFDGNNIVDRLDVEVNDSASYSFGVALIDFLKKKKIDKAQIKQGYICSVVPRLSRWVQIVINQLFNIDCVLAGDEIQSLIKKDKEISESLGGDLIADIVAATSIYGTPCIITDLGTVTKTLIIDKDGVFLGAQFYPGLKSSFESMSEKTALLPSLDKVKIDVNDVPKFKYGKNSVDCMKSGIYWGTISSVIYSNNALSVELGKDTKHIITGGYSKFLESRLSRAGMICDENLVLKGLSIMFNKVKK